MTYSLLIGIVLHDKGELITTSAVVAGSFGGTVLMGRGLSSSRFAAALGIESSKDVVYILTDDEYKQNIFDAIVKATQNEKQHFGCLFCVDAGYMIKTGTISGGEAKMEQNRSHELITVIVNRGYADDAMAAARKAGASGGTAINARGTAREDDEKFFGMHIVPEKELLLIVVDQNNKAAVLEAIRTLDCLSEPGSGIAYCSPVSDFTLLGKKSS